MDFQNLNSPLQIEETSLPIKSPEQFLDLYESLPLPKGPFFDSNHPQHENARWSFFSVDPECTYQQDSNEQCIYQDKNTKKNVTENEFWDALTVTLQKSHFSTPEAIIPYPFISGWVGYFSYEYGLKDIKNITLKPNSFPLFHFSFFSNCIVYDTHTHTCTFLSTKKNDLAQTILNHLNHFINPKNNPAKALMTETPINLQPQITYDVYEQKIKTVQQHIKEGDIYQANFTHKFSTPFTGNPLTLYKKLRKQNPSPFAVFYPVDHNHFILSSSPERLFYIQNQTISAHPIKGTISRGSTPAEDLQNKEQLFNSSKDSAELAMIVDLIRNDIGQISEFGTVKVNAFKKVETFETVHHLIGIITGQLKKNLNIREVFTAMFPGGSITGAPKIRSIQILNELEESSRGPYTGSIGYIDLRKNMDFNILIRTILISQKELSFQSGGGITADSKPSAEYAETLVKSLALRTAVESVTR